MQEQDCTRCCTLDLEVATRSAFPDGVRFYCTSVDDGCINIYAVMKTSNHKKDSLFLLTGKAVGVSAVVGAGRTGADALRAGGAFLGRL